jgi:hypothetical protein
MTLLMLAAVDAGGLLIVGIGSVVACGLGSLTSALSRAEYRYFNGLREC